MNNKNKKYYKRNNYYKKNNKKEKKVTYDSLMKAEVSSNNETNQDLNKYLIIKCIAVSVVLFAIIIGSLLLFRKI